MAFTRVIPMERWVLTLHELQREDQLCRSTEQLRCCALYRSRRGNSSGSEDCAGGRAFRFHDRRCRARRIHPAGVPSLTTGNTQVLLAIKTLPRTAYPSSVNLLHSGDKNGTAMHLRAASHILEPS
ncbi:uncharacterized protein [Linepithema humile]|uniref:uncharacterized protein n=1 Tax=Linepithema humile TaxID=83485 RepID=UPI00351E12C5